MKIAIFTLPLNSNYGGILQAWALQTVLNRMGHEVVVWDKQRVLSYPFYRHPINAAKSLVKKILGRKIVCNEQYLKHIWQFEDEHINRCAIDTFENLDISSYDAVVVGSDQIFRAKEIHKQISDNIAIPFLPYDCLTKKIAYAVSFGTDEWEYTPTETNICKEYIAKFSALSVREKSGQNLMREHWGVDAQFVLDPTMLLTPDDYMAFCNQYMSNNTSKKLFSYILDDSEDKEKLVSLVAKDANCSVEKINTIGDDGALNSIQNWIYSIASADIVVTDSFHACVFSILFGKRFIAYGNRERGICRFTSLLKTFGLENRLIFNSDGYNDTMLNDLPTQTNDVLTEMRRKSFVYLQQSLS